MERGSGEHVLATGFLLLDRRVLVIRPEPPDPAERILFVKIVPEARFNKSVQPSNFYRLVRICFSHSFNKMVKTDELAL